MQLEFTQTLLQATSLDAVLFISLIIAVWFVMPRLMGLKGMHLQWGFDEKANGANYEHQPH